MLDNRTAYEAERTWVRDKEGTHNWIVVVKATFDITRDGMLTLSENLIPPLYSPEYHGSDGLSSVRYEADLVAMKPGTDVYLNAIAYAPKGKPCKKVKVSFRVGRMHKELMVYGERTWSRRLPWRIAPSSPKAFQSMPITYEGAYGGFDQEHPNPQKHRIDFCNPVGTGVAYRKRHLIGKPAPYIENAIRKSGKRWPAGFGAVASYWSPRKELAGTYDDKWVAKRKPLLPTDYDPNWLRCAPLDQQIVGYLNGGERVELKNLTPTGNLEFFLPEVSLHFETYFGKTRKEHPGKLVSVIIESEGPRLILVWQTSMKCGHDEEYLDVTVIRQKDEKK